MAYDFSKVPRVSRSQDGAVIVRCADGARSEFFPDNSELHHAPNDSGLLMVEARALYGVPPNLPLNRYIPPADLRATPPPSE